MAFVGADRELECKSMVLTLHTLFDIPRGLVALDPRRESVELVLKPTAKYYSRNKRFCKLDLPEQHVAFSPSSIMFKSECYVLDFESAPPQRGLGLARSTTPHRAASFASSIPSNSIESLAAHSASAALGVASSTGKMPTSFGNDARGGSVVPPRPRLAFGEATEEEQDVDARSPGSPKLKTHTGASPAAASSPNKILLRYPTRSDLKVIIEVMVGVRQRRHDSAAVRWITPSWADRSIPGTITSFAAADGELMRHKLVNRFVGLTVGHLSCTMELPHCTEDLREVVPFAPTAITDAARRLCNDAERLRSFYTVVTAEQQSAARSERARRRRDFAEQLSSGISEATIYRGLLLDVCPDYFVRRIRRICALYPPTPDNSAWVRTDAAALAAEHAGREMALIRSLCAELGPDHSAISPRNRFLSYTNVQTVSDELWTWIKDTYPQQSDDILDYEPDVFMEALSAQYGQPEPPPIQYGFPPITYELDCRAYFCDSLRFPVNREHYRYRDEAMAARQTRVLLQHTPCERPLQLPKASARNLGEIDILLEKYRPEFAQLMPSIADAMEFVSEHNERLLRELLRESQPAGGKAAAHVGARERMRSLPYEVCPHGFHIFQSERPSGTYMALLTRFSEYTYISVSTLLGAIIYLDRLCLRHPRLLLTTRNIEKLLVASVRVASKVIDLRSVNNKNYAAIFSVPVKDMNALESEFLKLMGFDFFLSPKEFNNYAHLVQLPAAYMQMPSTVRLSTTANVNGNGGGASPPPPLASGIDDHTEELADVGHSGHGSGTAATGRTGGGGASGQNVSNNGVSLNALAAPTPSPPRASSPQSPQQHQSRTSRGGGASSGRASAAAGQHSPSSKMAATTGGSVAVSAAKGHTNGGGGGGGSRPSAPGNGIGASSGGEEAGEGISALEEWRASTRRARQT
ncbi:cyclin 11 [Novymonas esmeraldas]|uniref:Cyclin 11 n=1 Tax=Novymonas esmeraldas TaxID=1808958 RepID=A0AAW0ES52_9TRYP